MKLEKGKTYTNDISDLAIRITSNIYGGKTSYRFKAVLFEKRNGYVVETKNYKLDKSVPEKHGWYELKE